MVSDWPDRQLQVLRYMHHANLKAAGLVFVDPDIVRPGVGVLSQRVCLVTTIRPCSLWVSMCCTSASRTIYLLLLRYSLTVCMSLVPLKYSEVISGRVLLSCGMGLCLAVHFASSKFFVIRHWRISAEPCIAHDAPTSLPVKRRSNRSSVIPHTLHDLGPPLSSHFGCVDLKQGSSGNKCRRSFFIGQSRLLASAFKPISKTVDP